MATLPKYDLKEVLQRFRCNTSFDVMLGVEVEFYARNCSKEILLEGLESIKEYIQPAQVLLEEEEGEGQFELVFSPQTDLIAYAQTIQKTKDLLKKWLLDHHHSVSFAAKPFPDQPNSALHVHISLYDQKNGKNIFMRDLSGEESPFLLWSVAGLLNNMIDSMVYFAPNEEDYLRYQHPDRNTPVNVSWGGDNRTVALRLPPVGEKWQDRRIEHRVSSPMASTETVFSVLLNAIHKGLSDKQLPLTKKIYGNAFDYQYDLVALPKTWYEAVQHLSDVV
jgi:glutamine synthetase